MGENEHIERLKKENDSLKLELLTNKVASDLGNLKIFVEEKINIQKELEVLKLKTPEDSLNKNNEDLENKIKELTDLNIEIQNKLNHSTYKYSELQIKVNELGDVKESYSLEIENLKDENSKLTQNYSSLENDLDKANKVIKELDNKSDSLIRTLEKEKDINNTLKKELKTIPDQENISKPIKLDIDKVSKLPHIKTLINLNSLLIEELEESKRSKLLNLSSKEDIDLSVLDNNSNLNLKNDSNILEKKDNTIILEKDIIVEETIDDKIKNVIPKEESVEDALNDLFPELDFNIELPIEDKIEEKIIENIPVESSISKEINLEFVDKVYDIETLNETTEENKETDNLVDNFFDNLMKNKSPEKKNSLSRGGNIFPRHEIMDKEELKDYGKLLGNKITYNRGVDKENERKMFQFLVSFAFYHYENGDFWHPLCDFIGIEFNNTVLNSFYSKIKKAANLYGFIYYIDTAKRNAYVETIKMHTLIPLNYIYNVLPTLYSIYKRDLKGIINKDVFSKILEDKFENKELNTIKTLEHLWEMKQEETVLEYFYELLLAVDSFDKNIDIKDSNLRKDVLDEIKEWCSNSNNIMHTTKGSIANYFDRRDLKDPSFILDYNKKILRVKSFVLPDNILTSKVKITYFENNKEISETRPLVYAHKNGSYYTTEISWEIKKEGMIFGTYEIILDTDDGKEISIYSENRSYILLSESYSQIRNLEKYTKDYFYVHYLSNHYELVSSSDITVEKVSSTISRVLLDKNQVNFLRDPRKRRIVKRLTIIDSSDINFISKRVEGLSVNNVPVFNSHPHIDGFINKEHILYVNNKREFEISSNDIGEYSLVVKSRNNNKTINSIKYYLIPDISISFDSYYNFQTKRYIFRKPTEMNLSLETSSFDSLTTEKYMDADHITKENYGFDLLINEELVDYYFETGEIFLKLSNKEILIPMKYKLPMLSWQLGDEQISDYGGEIWKNEIISNNLKVYLGGKQPIMSLPVNEFIDYDDPQNINFNTVINNALKMHNIKEVLFNVITTNVIYNEASNIFTVFPVSKGNTLEIYNEGKELLNKSFDNDFSPIEFDVSLYRKNITINIKKNDPFAFDSSDEILFKDSFFINEDLKVGEILRITDLEIYDKHSNLETTKPIKEQMKFKYLGEAKEGNYIGEILGFNWSQRDKTLLDNRIYFKLNKSQLIVKKLKVKQKDGKYMPVKYKLKSDSSLSSLFTSHEEGKHWETDNQNFGFKLKKLNKES